MDKPRADSYLGAANLKRLPHDAVAVARFQTFYSIGHIPTQQVYQYSRNYCPGSRHGALANCRDSQVD